MRGGNGFYFSRSSLVERIDEDSEAMNENEVVKDEAMKKMGICTAVADGRSDAVVSFRSDQHLTSVPQSLQSRLWHCPECRSP